MFNFVLNAPQPKIRSNKCVMAVNLSESWHKGHYSCSNTTQDCCEKISRKALVKQEALHRWKTLLLGFISQFVMVLSLTSTSPPTCLCLHLVQALIAGAQVIAMGILTATTFLFGLACDLNKTDIPKTTPLSLSHKLTGKGIQVFSSILCTLQESQMAHLGNFLFVSVSSLSIKFF